MGKLKIKSEELYRIIIESIIAFAFIGVVVTVCLILEYRQYRAETSKTYSTEQVQAAGTMNEYLSRAMAASETSLRGFAEVSSNEEYCKELKQLNEAWGFIESYYIVGNQIWSSEDVLYGERNRAVQERLEGVGDEEIHMIYDAMGTGDVLMAISVSAEETVKGKIVSLYDGAKMFDLPGLKMVERNTNCFLISASGPIAGEGGKDLDGLKMSKGDDFYVQLLAFTKGDNKAKKIVNGLKNALALSPKDQQQITFKSRDRENCIVTAVSVGSGRRLFLITVVTRKSQNTMLYIYVRWTAVIAVVIVIISVILLCSIWKYMNIATERVQKIAFEDPVTGGKNLNYFSAETAKMLEMNAEVHYIMQRFDISNFRHLNDAYGHLRADDILKACVEIYQSVFTDGEMCVRMNADQFVAIAINDSEVDERRRIYEEKLNEYTANSGIKYPVRLKFGVYPIRKSDKDIDIMIDRANEARRQIVSVENVNVSYYSEALIMKMRKEERIEAEMNNALETGEFKVFLQPKWDIVEDHVAGAEALIRWIKADGNMVYPDEFIPVFERNGFINRIDFYMFEQICKRMSQLQRDGGTLYPISVNQSKMLLHNPDYVNNVVEVYERYQMPKEFVELELTETTFIDDREEMIRVMKELKENDVRLDMDDFGSGYSSLNTLKDMPFDVIKIDREFFSESIASSGSTFILQKIIEMADGLGMEVICEGVENEEQVQILRGIGCRRVQGYYYGKPMPMEEFIKKYCET